jgi:hypothetical protein
VADDRAGRAEERRERAHARAAYAETRAAAARARALELARGDESTFEQVRHSAKRQAEHASDALLHSAEGHERAAAVFDEAALLHDERGDAAAAAADRERAQRSRSAARADRDIQRRLSS